MCSFFSQRMENDHGDLADIVRAKGRGGGSAAADHNPAMDFQFPPQHTNLSDPVDDSGDPFSSMRDPFLHELGSVYFGSSSSGGLQRMNMEEDDGNFLGEKIPGGEMKMPSNIFSRVLQISPKMPSSACNSPGKLNSPGDNGGALQSSSPRNNSGIKRRKNQAKKVVCIPAPVAANSRPGGEVVPSDLWAWRKYGQKPIKGSPYPRGYYRCSSSKGCSARKQVERSRTDPNMLVITYTSEHNHPWPTQRNALAGSIRSQPVKNKSSPFATGQNPPSLKEEEMDSNSKEEKTSATTSMKAGVVKEEMSEIEKRLAESGDGDFDHGCHPNHRLFFPLDCNQSDELFPELGELDPDPLDLMFAEGFGGEKSDEEDANKAALDPFSLFDWRS